MPPGAELRSMRSGRFPARARMSPAARPAGPVPRMSGRASFGRARPNARMSSIMRHTLLAPRSRFAASGKPGASMQSSLREDGSLLKCAHGNEAVRKLTARLKRTEA